MISQYAGNKPNELCNFINYPCVFSLILMKKTIGLSFKFKHIFRTQVEIIRWKTQNNEWLLQLNFMSYFLPDSNHYFRSICGHTVIFSINLVHQLIKKIDFKEVNELLTVWKRGQKPWNFHAHVYESDKFDLIGQKLGFLMSCRYIYSLWDCWYKVRIFLKS